MATLKYIVINVVLLALVAVVTFSAARMVRQAWDVRGETRELNRELTRLKSERRMLEARINALSLPGTIERKAKERLNLRHKGEEVVVVLPPASSTTQTAPAVPWWKRILAPLFSPTE
jgi:cell division protein FtsL